MILYGALVATLFYSLFITYVIITEPPRLSLNDAVIWGWIWALAFGYCTFGSLKLYRQFCEGEVRRMEYSVVTRRLMNVTQVAGGVIGAYLLLYAMNSTEETFVFWHIGLPLLGGGILLGILLYSMYRDRRMQNSLSIVGKQKCPLHSRMVERYLFFLFCSLSTMTLAFAALSCFEKGVIHVDVFWVLCLLLMTFLCGLYWYCLKRRVNK